MPFLIDKIKKISINFVIIFLAIILGMIIFYIAFYVETGHFYNILINVGSGVISIALTVVLVDVVREQKHKKSVSFIRNLLNHNIFDIQCAFVKKILLYLCMVSSLEKKELQAECECISEIFSEKIRTKQKQLKNRILKILNDERLPLKERGTELAKEIYSLREKKLAFTAKAIADYIFMNDDFDFKLNFNQAENLQLFATEAYEKTHINLDRYGNASSEIYSLKLSDMLFSLGELLNVLYEHTKNKKDDDVIDLKDTLEEIQNYLYKVENLFLDVSV